MRLLIFLILLPCCVAAQEKYFKYDELTYSSEIEERTIKSLLNDSIEPMDAFLAISPEDSLSFEGWKKRFSNEIDQLKKRKVAKKIEKDVKFIYDRLHENFLRKYENVVFFDEIFESGTYNCVTAVALYAMSFEELGISYRIKETPTHVYIVADPDESQLLIETTDPVSGFQKFSPGFRESFVAQLGLMKMVDQEDIASKGIYGVFDDIYFGGDELSLKELVGIQYYNQGVGYYEKNDYHNARRALSKAQLFHSTEQIDALLFSSLANALANSDYSDWEDVTILPYLERFKEHDVKDATIVGEFQRMLNYILVSNNDPVTADKAYNHYMSKSINTDIQNEISFYYLYERARITYNRANFKTALNFITKAYKIKPGNPDAENILLEAFRGSYQNKPTNVTLAALDTLLTNNPDLLQNNHLSTMQLNLYLLSMGENFDSRNATDGNAMRELFEKTLSENPDMLYDDRILGNAYSKAAVYYFKRGHTNRSRSIIRAGLQYSPGNYELKTRLRMLNQ